MGAVSGPFFEDLAVGMVFDTAPSMTLTGGAAAVHQSIVGDRLRLALDAELARAVTGATGPLAHPALVCDVAIGQTTLATQRVKANLFYRGLAFHRFPVIGDTLFTRTEVVGLKQNSAKPGRAPTGLAALRMTTVDNVGRLVLDFYRCAMLPLRDGAADTGHADDLSAIGADQPRRARSDRRLGRRRLPRQGARRALRLRNRRLGAQQHRRRGEQCARTGPAYAEHRCHTP